MKSGEKSAEQTVVGGVKSEITGTDDLDRYLSQPIGKLCRYAQHILPESTSARIDVECLLLHVIKQSRTYLYSHPEYLLSDSEQAQVKGLLSRRIHGEPIAYIMGEQEFWGLMLKVNADTLIPRPETELLVEQALANLASRQSKTPAVLDIGTGSGAIALAVASEYPEAKIMAVDISEGALAVARANIERHGLRQVSVAQSDLFASVNHRYDVILSNPPYIAAEDDCLCQGDLRFEPNSALTAPDEGYALIARLIEEAPAYLQASGFIAIEHGYQQGAQVRALFEVVGSYAEIETIKDLAGLDRVTQATFIG